MLKLRFAPKGEMMRLWMELWEGISDYDQLPVGCRSLMPTVIRRMQKEQLSEDWKKIHGLDLSFLVGLPRFVWTRNKFMLNQTKRIAEHVGKDGIEIVAIKGTGELILDEESGMMRSTSDLDLLIRPHLLDEFTSKMVELGLELKTVPEPHLPIPNDQYMFMPTDGTTLYVDLHIMVNKYQADDRLTEMVWKRKVASKGCPTLFTPSPRERFWIALVNVFRLTNWYQESYLKYLNDVFCELASFDLQELKEVLQSGSELQISQDWQAQIIWLAYEVGIVDHHALELIDNGDEVSMKSGHGSKQSNRLRSFINNRINRVNQVKMRHALYLTDRYTTSWQARNEKGYFWRVMFFMVKEPTIQITAYFLRRLRNLFRYAQTELTFVSKSSYIPSRQIMWEI